MKKIKVFDVIIVVFSLLVGVGVSLASPFVSGAHGERVCIIKVDGREVRRIELDAVSEEEIIRIDNHYGENHISVSPEGVKVIYSDCARKVEMKDSPINKPGQSLVCLPHRLIIEISGDILTPDAVTY